jgi:hypothetical protein
MMRCARLKCNSRERVQKIGYERDDGNSVEGTKDAMQVSTKKDGNRSKGLRTVGVRKRNRRSTDMDVQERVGG